MPLKWHLKTSRNTSNTDMIHLILNMGTETLGTCQCILCINQGHSSVDLISGAGLVTECFVFTFLHLQDTTPVFVLPGTHLHKYRRAMISSSVFRFILF